MRARPRRHLPWRGAWWPLRPPSRVSAAVPRRCARRLLPPPPRRNPRRHRSPRPPRSPYPPFHPTPAQRPPRHRPPRRTYRLHPQSLRRHLRRPLRRRARSSHPRRRRSLCAACAPAGRRAHQPRRLSQRRPRRQKRGLRACVAAAALQAPPGARVAPRQPLRRSWCDCPRGRAPPCRALSPACQIRPAPRGREGWRPSAPLSSPWPERPKPRARGKSRRADYAAPRLPPSVSGARA
mmetsp:Transcript_10137/g.42053  ORF Transcript_10137/g.42053 Transcript_10137/m.42053 type:complete len:237 (+) Transcript_10137:1666-2376(+)